MEIKKFNNFNEEQSTKNYMFFENLKNIKRYIDEILSIDEVTVDKILEEHDWACDHITSARENIEQVYNFLLNDRK